jgi:hypothetical protein
MPIDNPRFLEFGDSPGVPRRWTVRSFVRGERLAGFGPLPFEGVEGFERWSELVTALGIVEQAFFDTHPEGYEDFTEGWGVDAYVTHFDDAPAALTKFGIEPVDAFSAGWGVDGFAWSFTDVDVMTATFLGKSAEGFERGHRNDNYRWHFSGFDLVGASLSSGGAETFESTWPEHDDRGGGHHGE